MMQIRSVEEFLITPKAPLFFHGTKLLKLQLALELIWRDKLANGEYKLKISHHQHEIFESVEGKTYLFQLSGSGYLEVLDNFGNLKRVYVLFKINFSCLVQIIML